EVAPGETIRVETEDALGATFRTGEDIGPQGFARLTYPLTGPIAVRGAEPGDTLAVRVDGIELSDQGVVLYRGGGRVRKDWLSGHAGRIVAIRDGFVHFDEAIRIPVRPMIGKIGTAPALEVIRTSTPGVHGGNMDCPELAVGSTIYLPVEVAGGLLSV